MDRIGVGVIGCGFVGRGAHVSAFNNMEDAHLVAISDVSSKLRSKLAKKYDLKATYEDYTDLINDPDIQAVVVSTPTQTHAKISMEALEAGKHVLCEMPLAANMKEADELIALAATKKDLFLMPSLTFRFTPPFVRTKQMIAEGILGEPCALLYRELIPAADLARQWPPGAWVWNLEESGGPLYTLAVWSIDLFRWLFECEIAEVKAETKYTPLEQHGGTLGYDACVSMRMENGVVGALNYSGSSAPSVSMTSLEVVGSTNRIIRTDWNDKLTLFSDEPAETRWNVGQPGARQWGHHQQDEYFVRCIKEGTPPEITPEDGRKAMEISLQIG